MEYISLGGGHWKILCCCDLQVYVNSQQSCNTLYREDFADLFVGELDEEAGYAERCKFHCITVPGDVGPPSTAPPLLPFLPDVSALTQKGACRCMGVNTGNGTHRAHTVHLFCFYAVSDPFVLLGCSSMRSFDKTIYCPTICFLPSRFWYFCVADC